MKSFIKKRLLEALNLPSTNLSKPIEVSQDELSILKEIQWSDIMIGENGDDGKATLYMSVTFKNDMLNNVSNGINFSIQLLHDTYYQPHMFLSPSIQGIGLSPKILKAFIMEFGHIYAGKGRTINQDANKMLAKLTNDPDMESFNDDLGLLILKKGNPDKVSLLNIIR